MKLDFIPKKYLERVDRVEAEDGLIDDCKYMLYFKDGWAYEGEYWCLPCKSKKEILEFVRDSWKEKED
jgi:hypothetical protein